MCGLDIFYDLKNKKILRANKLSEETKLETFLGRLNVKILNLALLNERVLTNDARRLFVHKPIFISNEAETDLFCRLRRRMLLP